MRHSESLTWLLAAILGLSSTGLANDLLVAESPAIRATPVSYTAEERRLIDEGAMWGPRERRNVAPVEAYASAHKWLVARTPLPVAEEIRRAGENDQALRSKYKTSEPPTAATKVFQKLVGTLPARMRPENIEFTLTVIERSERDALTLGAGRVYVGDSFLTSLLDDDRSEPDQLAFVLAHELGHISLGHVRRVYQRLWMYEQVRKDLEAMKKKRKETNRPRQESKARADEPLQELDQDNGITNSTLAALAGVGMMLEYVYTREEQFQADLFAIHLCRNAGFDLENCLDLLRRKALQEDASLLEKHPAREGTPPVEPEVQPHDTGEALTLANHPTAMQRLRRLRLELDGLIYGEKYGLFEYDREKKTLERAADHCVPDMGRVVVCIHGMESSLGVYLPLMKRLAADPSGAEFRILGFQYPNDESLSRSGKFLWRETQRVCAFAKHIDFVCHSAGGLVFRHYAEIERGEFQHVYFQGTPHRGSDLAALRSLLEAAQFMGDLKLGYDGALKQAILDGHGQISIDLEPDSLFLTYLNSPRDNPGRDRYVIYRGQALTRTVLLKAAVDAARASLDRTIKNDDSTVTKFARAALEKVLVPAEITSGDLAVTLESATLDGVETVHTHPLRHTELPRDPAVIDHLVKLLVNEK